MMAHNDEGPVTLQLPPYFITAQYYVLHLQEGKVIMANDDLQVARDWLTENGEIGKTFTIVRQVGQVQVKQEIVRTLEGWGGDED